MRVFRDFDVVGKIKHPVLTIGTFDGVHIGHQKIIQQINAIAKEIDGESVLFTFYPHPRMVLFPDGHGLQLIQTQEEKMSKLAQVGLQNTIVYPFTKSFSRLSALEFVRDFLVNQLHVHTVVIGYDHHFGKNREGSLELLQEFGPIYGFNVVEIPAQDIEDVNVSSTKIRNAILSGDFQTANAFLGNYFDFSGSVIKGRAIGRKIGFPTANIQIDSDIKIVPADGVYFSITTTPDNKKHFSLLNIGNNPTVNGNTRSIEVYLLDFTGDLYNQTLRVEIVQKIRSEKKFENVQALAEQLKKDEITARNILLNMEH
jgi:riboflavin kinase/FMN adenylyltransferase